MSKVNTRSLFGPIEFKYLHRSLRQLVLDTPEGEIGDTHKYRVDRRDGRVWVAAKQPDGRCGHFVQVWLD
jgi:hypothetical protein